MKRKILAVIALLLLAFSAGAEETKETEENEMVLSFIGDCSIGEALQDKGKENKYTWMLDHNGMDWPFSLVYDYLANDDFTFANLEVVFTKRTAHADKKYPLVGDPKYAEVLTKSGIDAVNTVNNHCFDYLVEGYRDTMSTLDSISFPHFGSVYVGSRNEQDVLLEEEVCGVKIGALGFSYPQDSDLTKIQERINKLREDGCQLVVVSLHWGRETHSTPESWQLKYARKVIDMGADVIWGHHAHVLQQVQFYNGGVIMYSTGNFTFGTMSSSVDRDTGIFQLTYQLDDTGTPVLSQFSVIPCRTTGMGDYRPYELTEEADRTTVFKKLIYPKNVTNMYNLPESFASTGSVQIQDGIPVE